MKATAKGIEINREELWALLSFTSEKEEFSAVHFRVNGRAKLEAAATDGKRSVECIAKAEKAEPGEWAIDAAFLEKCRSALGKDESLIIELTKSGLKDARVVNMESGDTICPIGWNREAASTQMSMSGIVAGLKLPDDKNHVGSWVAIDPEVLRGLTRVKVATDGCPITLWPPKDPNSTLFFEATGEAGHWKGAIVPETVLGPGEEADEPADEDDDAPGRNDRQTRLDLADRAKAPKAKAEEEPDDEDDGVIDDEEAEQLKAQQAETDEPELATAKPHKQRKVKPSQMRPKAKKGRGK